MKQRKRQKKHKGTSPNRPYLATVLCIFAQILLRGTSDTLRTLGEIYGEGNGRDTV